MLIYFGGGARSKNKIEYGCFWNHLQVSKTIFKIGVQILQDD
jgi:hypothetical protein